MLPLLLLWPAANCPVRAEDPPAQPAVTRIAFGACSRQYKEQPLWRHINAAEPDLFLFLGDNIYGDTDDMMVLREKYAEQDAVPGFRELRENTRILATWDDHDFGRNDAGAEYPHKAASQQVFLDFFREPADSERRRREGVYGAWQFGESGTVVQVILLDTRYHRSALSETPKRERPKGRHYFGPYQPNTDPAATILGEEQWQWLEQELRKPADLRIIGSSIQLISNGHWWEKWGNFPAERTRFFRLIRETRANGVILLSGDRHFGEVSRLPADAPTHGVGYPLHEFTSSGLTHARWFSPSGPNEHRLHPIHRGKNFGFIEIDWPERSVTVDIRDSDGNTGISTTIRLDELAMP
ncbi:MAG: alkaline phosphatase family protein, partial [Akkermansiaceae bacterium]|nr:alkaline phosphatase family protein [Akkermansiaceae bacterium]